MNQMYLIPYQWLHRWLRATLTMEAHPISNLFDFYPVIEFQDKVKIQFNSFP